MFLENLSQWQVEQRVPLSKKEYIWCIIDFQPDTNNPANICLFKVNNKNIRKRCEICSNLTTKTRYWHCSGIFIVNFEHISHLFGVFLLLTLNKQKLNERTPKPRIPFSPLFTYTSLFYTKILVYNGFIKPPVHWIGIDFN